MGSILNRMNTHPLLMIALGLVTISCATRTKAPYSTDEIRENIYLHYYKKSDGLKTKQRMKDSSYSLLRSTYPEFLIDLEHSANGTPFLNALPHGLSHGDFHPLQVSIRDGISTLDDWDTVQTGPLWRDIVRMESAGRLLAQEEGLRGYPETACIDAYADRVVKGPQKLTPFRPAGFKEDNYPDFSQSPTWQGAESESAIPKDLLTAFRQWVGQNPQLGLRSDAPLKRLVSGVGSLLKEKIILLDDQKRLWEMKEVDTRPGECAAYESLAKVFERISASFGPSPIQACWVWNQRLFTLIRWDQRYWNPEKADFKSAAQVADHVRWACDKLAEFHLASLNEGDTRTWQLAWKSSAPLKSRVREISAASFRRYQEGYRLILSEK